MDQFSERMAVFLTQDQTFPWLYIMLVIRLKSKIVLWDAEALLQWKCFMNTSSYSLTGSQVQLEPSVPSSVPNNQWERTHTDRRPDEEEQAQLWSLRLISAWAKQNLCCWSYLSSNLWKVFSKLLTSMTVHCVCVRDDGRIQLTPAWLVMNQRDVL